MAGPPPILELQDAMPLFDETGIAPAPFTMRLLPGDCALIACRDAERGAMFADLCCGMVTLSSGTVRCTGLDWTTLGTLQANALRGRIGRVSLQGAWLDILGTDANILLPQLHHTRRQERDILEEAQALAERFGLPGLPVERPSHLMPGDRLRAALVRACLGTPLLLVLENPIAGAENELGAVFLDVLTRARHRGAAVVLLTRDIGPWRGQHGFFTHRLHLLDEGMYAMRRTG